MCCFHYGGLSGGIIDRITKKTGNHDDEATAGSWETILNPTGAGNNTDVATNDYEYDDTLNNDDDDDEVVFQGASKAILIVDKS